VTEAFESDASISGVGGLKDAGKVVVEAAGTVAGERLRMELDARSSRMAVELKAAAVAMRASSASLQGQGHVAQADLVDELAVHAERLAARLASADTDDLLEDVKRLTQRASAFARKEPVLVIAGAFTLGLLVPKLLEAVTNELEKE
jgi:hypothetical protein